MEIVLIRHSQAEKRRMNLEDDRRNLTKKGEKKFQQLVPKLKEKLRPIDQRNLMLWSSPALRTLEVAHIVARNLEIETSLIHDFIYEGDFEAFNQELQTVSDETTLFLVGHQPYLSEWLYDMTGTEIQVKKGNIVNLKVKNKAPLQAELQWMITSQS